MKLQKIAGDLFIDDLEVVAFNEQYARNYDGYVLTPQTKRNTKQHLYGFYGLPLDEAEAYLVTTYYR